MGSWVTAVLRRNSCPFSRANVPGNRLSCGGGSLGVGLLVATAVALQGAEAYEG